MSAHENEARTEHMEFEEWLRERGEDRRTRHAPAPTFTADQSPVRGSCPVENAVDASTRHERPASASSEGSDPRRAPLSPDALVRARYANAGAPIASASRTTTRRTDPHGN